MVNMGNSLDAVIFHIVDLHLVMMIEHQKSPGHESPFQWFMPIVSNYRKAFL